MPEHVASKSHTRLRGSLRTHGVGTRVRVARWTGVAAVALVVGCGGAGPRERGPSAATARKAAPRVARAGAVAAPGTTWLYGESVEVPVRPPRHGAAAAQGYRVRVTVLGVAAVERPFATEAPVNPERLYVLHFRIDNVGNADIEGFVSRAEPKMVTRGAATFVNAIDGKIGTCREKEAPGRLRVGDGWSACRVTAARQVVGVAYDGAVPRYLRRPVMWLPPPG
jgi:hypothetical protein